MGWFKKRRYGHAKGIIHRKKFGAYQNPGTDEAEFSISYRTKNRVKNKSEYDKGRDKVKRILNDKKE